MCPQIRKFFLHRHETDLQDTFISKKGIKEYDMLHSVHYINYVYSMYTMSTFHSKYLVNSVYLICILCTLCIFSDKNSLFLKGKNYRYILPYICKCISERDTSKIGCL